MPRRPAASPGGDVYISILLNSVAKNQGTSRNSGEKLLTNGGQSIGLSRDARTGDAIAGFLADEATRSARNRAGSVFNTRGRSALSESAF